MQFSATSYSFKGWKLKTSIPDLLGMMYKTTSNQQRDWLVKQDAVTPAASQTYHIIQAYGPFLKENLTWKPIGHSKP